MRSINERRDKIMATLMIPNVNNQNRGYCILRDKDKQYDCYEDVVHEIQEKGLNQLDPFVMVYPKSEMYKIIFKVAGIEAMLQEMASEPTSKK
jgi:hypothetical protein